MVHIKRINELFGSSDIKDIEEVMVDFADEFGAEKTQGFEEFQRGIYYEVKHLPFNIDKGIMRIGDYDDKPSNKMRISVVQIIHSPADININDGEESWDAYSKFLSEKLESFFTESVLPRIKAMGKYIRYLVIHDVYSVQLDVEIKDTPWDEGYPSNKYWKLFN